jgi:hypothetical protein
MTVMMRKILGCGLRAAVLVVAVADLLGGTPTARSADWPQWRGPNRDGSSTETGWRSHWPEGGPKVLWKAKVGGGHSSIVAVGGRAYAVGRSWKVDHTCCGCECFACPTFSHGRIYCRSGGGELVCLDVRTGQ